MSSAAADRLSSLIDLVRSGSHNAEPALRLLLALADTSGDADLSAVARQRVVSVPARHFFPSGMMQQQVQLVGTMVPSLRALRLPGRSRDSDWRQQLGKPLREAFGRAVSRNDDGALSRRGAERGAPPRGASSSSSTAGPPAAAVAPLELPSAPPPLGLLPPPLPTAPADGHTFTAQAESTDACEASTLT